MKYLIIVLLVVVNAVIIMILFLYGFNNGEQWQRMWILQCALAVVVDFFFSSSVAA